MHPGPRYLWLRSGSMTERQRRTAGGRPHVVKVRLTDEEAGELRRRAARAGLSPPRLLADAALRRQSAFPNRALIAEFLDAKRALANAARDLNMAGRIAEASGRGAVETVAARDHVVALGVVMGQLAERLAGE